MTLEVFDHRLITHITHFI